MKHLSDLIGASYDSGWASGKEEALHLPISEWHKEAIRLRQDTTLQFVRDLDTVRMVLRSLRHCLDLGLTPSPELRADLNTISYWLSGDDDAMGYIHEAIHQD